MRSWSPVRHFPEMQQNGSVCRKQTSARAALPSFRKFFKSSFLVGFDVLAELTHRPSSRDTPLMVSPFLSATLDLASGLTDRIHSASLLLEGF